MTRKVGMKQGVVLAAILITILAGCKPKPRNLGGEIHGFVSTAAGKQDVGATVPPSGAVRIRIPDVRVLAKNTATNALSAPAVSNVNGHFTTPKLATGKYQLCLEAAGYVSNCNPQVFNVASENIVLNFDLPIVPEQGAVQGRVMLQDAAHVASHIINRDQCDVPEWNTGAEAMAAYEL